MKKAYFVVLLLSCILVGCSKSYKVTADSLKVRATPTESGKVISKLDKDDVIEVEKIENGWATIESYDSDEGIAYVSEKYIQPLTFKEKVKHEFYSALIWIILIGVFLIGGTRKVVHLTKSGAIDRRYK